MIITIDSDGTVRVDGGVADDRGTASDVDLHRWMVEPRLVEHSFDDEVPPVGGGHGPDVDPT